MGLDVKGCGTLKGEEGNVYHFVNGKIHRNDVPAIEYKDGSKEWLVKGLLHRLDGPAIEYANGTKFWYINGKSIPEPSYQKRRIRNKKIANFFVHSYRKLLVGSGYATVFFGILNVLYPTKFERLFATSFGVGITLVLAKLMIVETCKKDDSK
jgi:hypothetical protein